MSGLLFKILVIPLFYLFSRIPFGLIYPLSSAFAWLAYHVIRYRRSVVFNNLRNSFPEKSELELQNIAKEFYIHFCDVMFETFKLLSMSQAELKLRCSYEDQAIEDFKKVYAEKKTVIAVMGHCGNWEWLNLAHNCYFASSVTSVYHPFTNAAFDEFMLKLRQKNGVTMLPMKQVYRFLLTLRKTRKTTSLGLISDQTPPPESAYWTRFLNQETSFYNGVEKIAKTFDCPVIYVGIKKVKRGHYRVHTRILCLDPKTETGNSLSEKHIRALEEDIIAQPFNWLWSHRRWKHKKPSKTGFA